MYKFTCKDIGCYGDDTFGHAYLRSKLADLIADTRRAEDCSEVVSALRGEMSADAEEETEGLSLLDEVTEEGLAWTLDEGLCLISVEVCGA